MTEKHIDDIVVLITEAAKEIKNPSPTARVYAVLMKVNARVGKIMEALSHEENKKRRKRIEGGKKKNEI